MSLSNNIVFTGLASILLTITGCADWRTTPETVDRYHGMAVKNMIENQTLYPEHNLQHRQVLSIDGPKAETIMKIYREPQDIELQQGKEPVKVDVDTGH